MKIYFDNVLIDENAYAGLENTYKLFTDNFYLGSTASNTFKITIAKSTVSSHPSKVKITDDTNTYYLIVDKVTEEKNFYIYELVDKLVLFNFNYDASVLINERAEDELTTTLTDILIDMCSKAGIEIDENLTLINDIQVTWYDNTLLARDYLGFIAELQGGFARILNNGKLSIVGHNMSSQTTLNIGDVEEFIKSEEKTISKIVFDNGLVNWEVGNDTGNTLYLDPNNVYIVNEDIIGNIFNRVNGLNFWIGSITKCSLPNNIRAGDIITILDGVTPYNIIASYTSSYTDVNQVAMITNDVQTKQQETTQTIGINSKIFSIKTIIDRTNASVQTIAERVDDTETSISSITQDIEGIDVEVAKIGPLQTQTAQLAIDVNQLRSEIGDVTDITTQEEGAGTLLFESINTSEPINITIRPSADKDISYLYPSSMLFPSSSLFPQNRILRFYNSTEDETIDYLLPGNLRYLSSTVYDEYFLDFATATCKITRKVAIAEDMTKSALAVPVEETYTYPSIPLSAGNYTVTMLGYPNAYMKIRLMSQNMYTSQFATRVELSSAITQSANAINLEVAKKVDETEVIASINLTSETATINASKINIAGVITAMNNDTTTTIDGDKITTGSITAAQVSSGIITTSNLSAQNISATQITTGTLATARLSSDVITTTNFSAQNINADKITAGTLNGTNVNITNLNASNITSGEISADKINGGTITGSSINLGSGKFTVNTSGTLNATGATIQGTITATGGTIAGLTISSTELSNANAALRNNGTMLLYPQVGSGGYYAFNNGTRINVTAGVGIASNSNGSVALSGGNLDVKACSGSTAYLACMINSNGTGERSAVECANGTLYLRSTGAIYANGVAIGGSSSKATKKNIKTLSQEKKDELYELIKNIEIKEYDYKKMYGKKNNYGFVIEDIEKTKLNDLLHITQHPINKKIKTYSSEDLTRLCLITIQELMKKVEKLEDKND